MYGVGREKSFKDTRYGLVQEKISRGVGACQSDSDTTVTVESVSATLSTLWKMT